MTIGDETFPIDEVPRNGTVIPDQVNIIIPASQQQKLPLWKEVNMILEFKWATTDFIMASGISQNAVFSFRFDPPNANIFINLDGNNNIFKNESLTISTEGTTILGLAYEQGERLLAYEWECPQSWNETCELQQHNPILHIDNELVKTKLPYQNY